MNTKEKEAAVAAVAVTGTSHPETVQTRLQELRLMRDQIPNFVIPTSPKDTLRLTASGALPPEFVELTAVAIANENALVRGNGSTPAEIRDYLRYADSYDPLADEFEAMAHFVRHSVAAARHKAGVEALATYELAKRLAKLPETAGLAPYVADMRRALGRVRKLTAEQIAKKKAEKEAKTGKTTTPPAPPNPPAPKSE